jgi:hypothetical protein
MITNLYFNVELRYALGLPNLGDGHFDVRSVYNSGNDSVSVCKPSARI